MVEGEGQGGAWAWGVVGGWVGGRGGWIGAGAGKGAEGRRGRRGPHWRRTAGKEGRDERWACCLACRHGGGGMHASHPPAAQPSTLRLRVPRPACARSCGRVHVRVHGVCPGPPVRLTWGGCPTLRPASTRRCGSTRRRTSRTGWWARRPFRSGGGRRRRSVGVRGGLLLSGQTGGLHGDGGTCPALVVDAHDDARMWSRVVGALAGGWAQAKPCGVHAATAQSTHAQACHDLRLFLPSPVFPRAPRTPPPPPLLLRCTP